MKSNDFLKENIVDDAAVMHQDHEVQMARKECYHSAENAIKIHQLLQQISETQGLEGWVAAKITLASDYLTTVREYLEYQQLSGGQPEEPLNMVTVAEEIDDTEAIDEGFFVVIANKNDGAFVGMVYKDGGKWRESAVAGDAPHNWGGNYMSYLTTDDVMQHIRNDYSRGSEVKGPFYAEDEAMQYAQNHYDFGADDYEYDGDDEDTLQEMNAGSVAGVVNANGMGKKKSQIGSLFGGTYKPKKAKK